MKFSKNLQADRDNFVLQWKKLLSGSKDCIGEQSGIDFATFKQQLNNLFSQEKSADLNEFIASCPEQQANDFGEISPIKISKYESGHFGGQTDDASPGQKQRPKKQRS